jgi:hypothetical protein
MGKIAKPHQKRTSARASLSLASWSTDHTSSIGFRGSDDPTLSAQGGSEACRYTERPSDVHPTTLDDMSETQTMRRKRVPSEATACRAPCRENAAKEFFAFRKDGADRVQAPRPRLRPACNTFVLPCRRGQYSGTGTRNIGIRQVRRAWTIRIRLLHGNAVPGAR